MKKTLDFWEQGNIYPKEVVDYVKGSFLKQSKQDKGYYQTQFNYKKHTLYQKTLFCLKHIFEFFFWV